MRPKTNSPSPAQRFVHADVRKANAWLFTERTKSSVTKPSPILAAIILAQAAVSLGTTLDWQTPSPSGNPVSTGVMAYGGANPQGWAIRIYDAGANGTIDPLGPGGVSWGDDTLVSIISGGNPLANPTVQVSFNASAYWYCQPQNLTPGSLIFSVLFDNADINAAQHYVVVDNAPFTVPDPGSPPQPQDYNVGTCALAEWRTLSAPVMVHYVSPTGLSVAPYASWSNAATTIQAALNAAGPGHEVVVAEGHYVVTASVTLTNAVWLHGAGDCKRTIVDGSGTTRVFSLLTNAVVEGFTVTNGWVAGHGAGMYVSGGGTVRNCVLSGNRTAAGTCYGGGMFLTDTGLVERCLFHGNYAASQGGGAWIGYDTVARNCLFRGNTAGVEGGGLFCYRGATLDNCTIVQNGAGHGGGISCYTPDGNPASTVRNTILMFNTNGNYRVTGASVWTNCCTTPAYGTACVTGDPRFVSAARDDYRLGWLSPCIDAGVDLAGAGCHQRLLQGGSADGWQRRRDQYL